MLKYRNCIYFLSVPFYRAIIIQIPGFIVCHLKLKIFAPIINGRRSYMNNEQNSWDLPPKQKAMMIAALLTGAFMGIINETLLATALPSIQNAFSISQGEVQWMTTAFLMTNGIMIPVSAFLIDRFTTRGLFLTALDRKSVV